MAPPETTRQYLPDLEKRWGEFGITRRKIVEYARDGELDLWIELFDVKFYYRKEDGNEAQENASNIELKFYKNSLEQLCRNVDISRYHQTLKLDRGIVWNAIKGKLKDDRIVIVAHRQSFNSRRSKELPKKILIEYSKVYARIEDVREFEKKILEADISKKSAAQKKEVQLNTKLENNYLKMIGALLLMQYQGKAYIKSNGDVNASAVAERFNIDLANLNLTDDGLRKDTIRRTFIVQALEAIEENKK